MKHLLPTIAVITLPLAALQAAPAAKRNIVFIFADEGEGTAFTVASDALRHKDLGHPRKVQFTDFVTGVRYMEFSEAVARSAATGAAVELPVK